MTLNLGGGNYSDKIEEQMENEQEEERQQLRAVLEAEMNDDDLFSDEEDDEEYQQDVELHTTDDLTQKIPQNTGLSYENLLQMYNQRGDEINHLNLENEQLQDKHQRSLRSKDHELAQLEQQNKTLELDHERYQDKIAAFDNDIKSKMLELQTISTELESSHKMSQKQEREIYDLERQNETLNQQLEEALSNDQMSNLKIHYENLIEEKSRLNGNEVNELRDQLQDISRDLQRKTLDYGNIEKSYKSATDELDCCRTEYERLQDRYRRLGDEFTQFRETSVKPVPLQNTIQDSTLGALNFDMTSQTPIKKSHMNMDDGSYMVFAEPVKQNQDQFNQTHYDLRQELEKALSTIKRQQDDRDKTSRDQERLTKDVVFWKKQVEDLRDENNSTLRNNMSKMDILEIELENERKRVKESKLEISKVIDECDFAKKSNDEKIRKACDILHQDAVKKLRDQHEAELESRLYSFDVEHREKFMQADKVIKDLTGQLNDVKNEYVGIGQMNDKLRAEVEVKKQEVEAKNQEVLKKMHDMKQLHQHKVDKQKQVVHSFVQTDKVNKTDESGDLMKQSYANQLKKLKTDFMDHYRKHKERSSQAAKEQVNHDRAKMKEYYSSLEHNHLKV